jgi:anion-transporting  ArsA/GET3 family ATPase
MRPMSARRLIFVTGKGGVGKTTVAAALGQRAAALGGRTLIVETAGDGSLAHLFGHRRLQAAPRPLRERLDAVRVDARQLVEDYFSRLLRFSFLSRRLLASHTFNALTAAAPGVTEFLLLEKLLEWIDPAGSGRRRSYDTVLVDGPATGHAIKLLGAPRNLATMVPGGPIGTTARKLLALLADHARTQVVLVTLADEMSVRETIETCEAIEGNLALHVARPVVNRVFPRRFTRDEADRIQQSEAAHHVPVLAAARFAIACRREAERYVGTLRRALGVSPVLLRQLFVPDLRAPDLEPFGRTLGRVVLS